MTPCSVLDSQQCSAGTSYQCSVRTWCNCLIHYSKSFEGLQDATLTASIVIYEQTNKQTDKQTTANLTYGLLTATNTARATAGANHLVLKKSTAGIYHQNLFHPLA